MTSGNGVVAAKAIEILSVLGFDRDKVAAEVGCHRRTVARWEAGAHQPSKRNRAVLRAWISELYGAETSKAQTGLVRARVARLKVAADALMTHAEKAADAQFQAEMRAKRAAIIAQRQPRRSAHADTDPFAIFNNSAELAVAERAFA